MNYPTMKVSELRRLVRKRGLASGLAVAGARKAVLIHALSLGRWPDAEVQSGPSPSDSLVSGYWRLLDMVKESERNPDKWKDNPWKSQYYFHQGRILEALNGLDRGPHD